MRTRTAVTPSFDVPYWRLSPGANACGRMRPVRGDSLPPVPKHPDTAPCGASTIVLPDAARMRADASEPAATPYWLGFPLRTPKTKRPRVCDPRAFAFLGRSGRPTSHAERSVRDAPQTVAFAERAHAAVQAEAIAPGLDLFRVVDECVHGGRVCVFDAGRGPRSRTLRPLKNSCNTVRRRIGGRCGDACDHVARNCAMTSSVSITSANSARKVAKCARWICSAAMTLPSASRRSKQAQASPITVVR